MKKFTFKGVLDGFRQSVQPQQIKQEQEIQEQLKPEQFMLKKTFRHGFPYSPTSFAFDPVQKLIAIGDKSGYLRILGKPGVDTHAKHEGDSACAVILIEFVVNKGALVSVTADDTLHLWDIRQKTPHVVQSLKFQRERLTCIHVPVGSKWIHAGTEKGNVHIVHIETFVLSGYIINWNKAIEVTRTSHPGAVIGLCDNPTDANKLLIAFECGLLVLWDLKARCAEIRWQSTEPVKSIAWHYEGKYFVSSHTDGSICSWPCRPASKPQSLVCPHAKILKDGSSEKCKPIFKVDLKTTPIGDTITIFSGGMPSEKYVKSNCITVMVGKTTTVLEMEHAVVDFITLCENPWTCETQEPYAIAVLLQYDLVLIDLLTPGFPCFESPYPMDLHESPVTCCTYLTDCPSDLVPAFYSVGRITTSKSAGFSEREWPISGGEWAPASCSYSEIVITGHQDGSLKFWDSSAGTLQILYKLKTAKIFEKPKNLNIDDGIYNPLGIQIIYLCSESRRLCVAGAMGQVLLFKFRKVESTSELIVLEIPIIYDNYDDIYGATPECDFIPHQVQKTESSESDKVDHPLKVKFGPQRKLPGFQCQLVCITTGSNKAQNQITSLCINSCFELMAYGTEYGLVIVDIAQKICLLSVACPDLYGAQDPFLRNPKSPKRIENREEQNRSPGSDQLNDNRSPDSPSIEHILEENEAHSLTFPNQSNSSRSISPEIDLNVTKSLLQDEMTIPVKEIQPDRRKSMSWKTFNFKRQLSKVNIKIGYNVNNESESMKNNSTFYAPKEGSPEDICDDNIEVSDTALSYNEKIMNSNTVAEVNKHDNPLKTINKSVPSTYEKQSTYLLKSTVMPTTNKENDVNNSKELGTLIKDVDSINTDSCNKQVSTTRPCDLPLSPSIVSPIKSNRLKFKDKREQRLLSVPNIKYQMRDFRTRSNPNKTDVSPSSIANVTRLEYKIDGSFSRSRSSSMSSIDMSSAESVTCLAFIDSYAKRNDMFSLYPTLWVGTSFGSVLTLFATMPDQEQRRSQPVLVTINGGPVIRLKGSITSMSFLDAFGSIIPYSFELWRDDSKDSKKDRTPTKGSTKTSPILTPTTASTIFNPSVGGNTNSISSASTTGISGSNSTALDSCTDRQYVVVTSVKQTKVFDVINQCCIYRIQLTEMGIAVKAETITMKDGTCLATYLSNGHLMVHSLPSLKLLMDIDFLPLTELSFHTKNKQGIVDPMLAIWGQQVFVEDDATEISKVFCLSHKGHGLYMASPTEIQKFTISSEFCQFISEMMGEMFTCHEMPEQPKENFFKGLFGGGAKSLDREELFGEQSGKANRSVAKHIAGTNLEQLGQKASTAASEISRAHQLAMERGEKLNLLEERAERMANQAQDFSGTAHQLMLKYKDKKWYQL